MALAGTLGLMGGGPAKASDQTLVAAGSDWRYDDTGVDRGTAWRLAGYDDVGVLIELPIDLEAVHLGVACRRTKQQVQLRARAQVVVDETR